MATNIEDLRGISLTYWCNGDTASTCKPEMDGYRGEKKVAGNELKTSGDAATDFAKRLSTWLNAQKLRRNLFVMETSVGKKYSSGAPYETFGLRVVADARGKFRFYDPRVRRLEKGALYVFVEIDDTSIDRTIDSVIVTAAESPAVFDSQTQTPGGFQISYVAGNPALPLHFGNLIDRAGDVLQRPFSIETDYRVRD